MATFQVMRQAPLDSNVGKLTFGKRCVVHRVVDRNQKEGVETGFSGHWSRALFQVMGHAPFDSNVGKLTFDERCVVHRAVGRNQEEGVGEPPWRQPRGK